MNPEPLSLSMDIVADDAVLEGTLYCPGNAAGLVIFAHGSGSSRPVHGTSTLRISSTPQA